MKSDPVGPSPIPAASGNGDDSSKFISILALAAGALAIPQTGHADVIVTDLGTNSVTIGPGAGSSFLTDNLPGTARLGFQRNTAATLHGSSRNVSAAQKAGYVRLKTNANSFALPVGKGVTWNQIAGTLSNKGLVGQANGLGVTPASYDHMYLAFLFKDSTQVGSPVRYGWVELSLANPPSGAGPDVTIFGYAYDNTGAALPTGSIPEPAPLALLALGALTLGAKGLRSWRRQRATHPPA